MYTNGKPAGTIAKFIDFVLSADGQKIVNEVKYVSIK
jgi:phosphate transport system substrate-binding protein